MDNIEILRNETNEADAMAWHYAIAERYYKERGEVQVRRAFQVEAWRQGLRARALRDAYHAALAERAAGAQMTREGDHRDGA